MKANGDYVNGVGYALAKLGAIANVYNYIDAGAPRLARLGRQLRPVRRHAASRPRPPRAARSTNVHGFITNTANYSALQEPYFTINDTVNGTVGPRSRSGSTGTSTSTS